MRALILGLNKILDSLFVKHTLQERVRKFTMECFGHHNTYDRRERAFRFGEEALEVMQAAGLTTKDILALLEHVYSQKPGYLRKELANAHITLLSLATANSIELDSTTESDLNWAMDHIPEIQARYKQKNQDVCSVDFREQFKKPPPVAEPVAPFY